jgi:uncharacterized lipoprotein YddW (UPF0748 family)
MTDRRRAHGRRLTAVLVSLIAGGLPLVALPASPTTGTSETRALWVLRTSLLSPQHIDRLVEDAAASGINTLFLQVRGRGDAYYAGSPEPRAADMAPGFDPLAHAIARARRSGLRVHAWINVNLVASAVTVPAEPRHVVRAHPEWLMVPRDLAGPLQRVDPRSAAYLGRLAQWAREHPQSIEGLYLSPIPPGAARYLEDLVGDLAERYDVHGVHFDYIRYPSAVFDYSRPSLAAFRDSMAASLDPAERRGLDDRLKRDPFAYTSRFPERWAHYRRLRLTDFLARLRAAVKRARPDALLSAAVVADPREAIEGRLQDWPDWGRRGLIDVVCPMAYTDNLPRFRRQIAEVGRAVAPRPQWAGIGAYRLTAAATATHIGAAREAGADGFVLFSYDAIGTPATRRAWLSTIGRLTFASPRPAPPRADSDSDPR